MVQKISPRKIIGTLAIACLLAQLATLSTSCKHQPLFDDDGLGPIDSTDTIDIIDTIPTGTPCDPDKVYFESQVLPILISNCAMSGCHNAASHQDGVVLDSYAKVMQTGKVKPFKPNDSDLYEVITETDLDDRMPPPPNAALSQDQIQVIRKWIEQGALDLKCDPNAGGCDTTNVSFSQTLSPVINTFCKGCHSGTNPSAGIGLDTYNGVKTVALNGKLYGAIAWSTGFQKMPQGGNKLDACTISQFKSWIDAGAPGN